MKKLALSAITIVLVSCGPGELFEARTYGVRNSQWASLSSSERHNAKQLYLQEQALAEQRRMNDLLAQQNAELIKERQHKEYQSRATNYHVHNNHYDYYAPSSSTSRLSAFDQQTRKDKEQRSMLDEQQKILTQIQQQNTLAQQNSQEQYAIEEAKRRSLETYRQEQQRASAQRASEQQALEEAKRRSLETYQQEQARKRQLRQQEQHDLEQAINNSMQTYNAEQAARNNTQSTAMDNWQPNEGQIVRAGELVMSLQRELGRQPSPSEMQNKLQANMRLSVAQSNKILDDLGLI